MKTSFNFENLQSLVSNFNKRVFPTLICFRIAQNMFSAIEHFLVVHSNALTAWKDIYI